MLPNRSPLPLGSIPACAGKPVRRDRPRAYSRVYPRRVRGSRLRSDTLRASDGSIPACAGKPKRAMTQSGGRTGLSPRVRGSHRVRCGYRVIQGSIPACAGKPARCSDSWAAGWVYPRVCGEASGTLPASIGAEGLSPRVRGSLARVVRIWLGLGSIPACAGKPQRLAARFPPVGVYPRVCGEAAFVNPVGKLPWGLSPRVRGSPRSP